MTIYNLTVQCNQFFDYTIEADSEEDAKIAVQDGLSNYTHKETDYQTGVVISIEEKTND